MDTKALRQKILDLAIRGKLVPQDPNDEPASVLLERIRKQKQQMFKEGKLKKKDIKNDTIIFKGEDNLHYEKFQDGTVKCIEDEIPFELPEGWCISRISSLTSIITDGEHKTPHRCDDYEGYYLLSARNIQNGFIALDNVDYVDQEEFSRISKRCNPKRNDILISCSGSVGRVTVVNDENKYVMVRSAAMVRFIEIIPMFAMYALQSPYLQVQMQQASKQTAQANLFQAAISNLLVPVPPLSEQCNIVQKVSALLEQNDSIEQSSIEIVDLISKAKSIILDLAIRGKLVPQDSNDEPASVLLERIRAEKEELIKQGKIKRDKKESIIFKGEDNSYYETIKGKCVCIDNDLPLKIPFNWTWSKIDNIAFVTKLAGFEYTENIAPNLCKNGIPLFKGKNVQDSTIIYEFEAFIPEDISDELSRSQITRKCILTPYVGTIGNIGIHNKSGKYHLGSNVGKIELYNDNIVLLEEYVVAYLQSSYGYQQLTKHMKATAQPSISIEAIRDVYIPIPPEKEQKEIVWQLQNISSKFKLISDMLS